VGVNVGGGVKLGCDVMVGSGADDGISVRVGASVSVGIIGTRYGVEVGGI